jgi:hypothetical protein
VDLAGRARPIWENRVEKWSVGLPSLLQNPLNAGHAAIFTSWLRYFSVKSAVKSMHTDTFASWLGSIRVPILTTRQQL